MCITGGQRYKVLPLHSQIPREEQRRVFEPVGENVTKVSNEGLCAPAWTCNWSVIVFGPESACKVKCLCARAWNIDKISAWKRPLFPPASHFRMRCNGNRTRTHIKWGRGSRGLGAIIWIIEIVHVFRRWSLWLFTIISMERRLAIACVFYLMQVILARLTFPCAFVFICKKYICNECVQIN